MPPAPEKLRKIKSFTQLVAYLRDDLDWPIESDDFEEITFDWDAEELGIDKAVAAKIQSVKQLRKLESSQKWGIFFVKFEPKKLPMVAMRRLLNGLILKRRASSQKANQASWEMHDLLFISEYGQGEQRKISFAQFAESNNGNLADLKVLSWGETQTDLTLEDLDQRLRSKLTWPTAPDDTDAWREQWSGAFTRRLGHVIRTSKDLAAELANLAIAIFNEAQTILEIENENGPLTKLYKAFQLALIHDLTEKDFADMYAQTITYGLFSTAVSGTDTRFGQGTFVNTERMVQLVPPTNPFLREMLATFLTAGGENESLNFDELGINEVVELLNDDKTDLPAVIREFGNRNKDEDPVIHFYEEFLKAYDADLRFQRGVFYTPQPVVSYIVRSVHELLQTEFGLADGLADTTTWGEMVERFKNGNPTRKRGTTDEKSDEPSRKPLEIPDGMTADDAFVQILDPATGTATFLVEVIDVIHKTMTAKWEAAGKTAAQCKAAWNEYVPKHLLPRVYGYELMMAPYAIAHMKMGLKLTETGYSFDSKERARLFLTNALEGPVSKQATLGDWFPALAEESNSVSKVKKTVKFTVVLGNPPYSKNSSNRASYAEALVQKYKDLVHGERNVQPLSDDYVKFIARAFSLTAETSFVVSMITNRSFLDGLIHRGMRSVYVSSLNLIRVTDLHGDSNVGEIVPDGMANENVFDITQGVAISTFASTLKTRDRLEFFHGETWGTRIQKYEILSKLDVKHQSLPVPQKPYFFFCPKDLDSQSEQLGWPSIDSLFRVGGMGVKTRRDKFLLAMEKTALEKRFTMLAGAPDLDAARSVFGVTDNAQWTLKKMRDLVVREGAKNRIEEIAYRPFDKRYIWYHREAIERGDSRWPVMQHLLNENISLLTSRQSVNEVFTSAFVSTGLSEMKTAESSRGSYAFPLYLYTGDGSNLFRESKQVNLDFGRLGEYFKNNSAEVAFAYIYSILFSPSYRRRYSGILRIEFPRIPTISNSGLGNSLAEFGRQLIELHTLDFKLANFEGISPTAHACEGVELDRVRHDAGRVFINAGNDIYFDNISNEVWSFDVGGYQPLQKWLKDRQAKGGKNPRPGRKLTTEDIEHYQKMVVAIRETIRLMGEIDEVIEEHGGWPGAFVTEPLDSVRDA